MEPTVPFSTFDAAYESGIPPWVIGEPQPAVVELERAGGFSGAVLDAGCGAGEHTVHLARHGHDVLGVDFAPRAVELARRNAEQRGVEARFEVADALRLPEELGRERFDTVLDSALFHVFGDEDRGAYVHSLYGVCRPGAVLHLLALSDKGPGVGPQIGEEVLRGAFEGHTGWEIESLGETTYVGLVPAHHAETVGAETGSRFDSPAWQARLRRV